MGASHVGVRMCTERGNPGICCGVWVHHMLVCVCAPSGEIQGFAVGYGSITCWWLYVHRAGKCGYVLWGMGASHAAVCICTERGNAGICSGVWVHHMLVCVCAPSGEMRGFVLGYGCISKKKCFSIALRHTLVVLEMHCASMHFYLSIGPIKSGDNTF